jgi:dTDP-4-amino-4,6-dideoxygalactose transaminase
MISHIAVMRPKLPRAAAIARYIEKIDAARTYSNFGPLNTEFQRRLEERYGVSEGAVTTISNATDGLALTLTALGAQPGSLCLMPAWTFIASAHAALAAGLQPYFLDVDEATWALTPEAVKARLDHLPGPVGAVMPVAPFGYPLDGEAWDRFTEETGVPVVIDAAAGFDVLKPARTPAVVSLHATKVLGVGEGGFVLSRNLDLIKEVRQRTVFGFFESRVAQMPASNAKLSEYAAAVGLAAMDEWAETRADWMRSANHYAQALAGNNAAAFQAGFGDTWVASACVLRLARAEALDLEAALTRGGVETRRWWGAGAHRHPPTEALRRDPLPVTEMLVESTLAVPFYRDLPEAAAAHVVSLITEAQGVQGASGCAA